MSNPNDFNSYEDYVECEGYIEDTPRVHLAVFEGQDAVRSAQEFINEKEWCMGDYQLHISTHMEELRGGMVRIQHVVVEYEE